MRPLRIGPFDIPIEATDDPSLDGIFQVAEDGTPTIRLNSNLCEAMIPPTTLHEALHCMSELYGIGLKERQVRALETCLTAFVRENPGFVDRLRQQTSTGGEMGAQGDPGFGVP